MCIRDRSFDGHNIDLVYNRVTDFALDQPGHKALRDAYRDGTVVITPNPHNHALLADKRNLSLLSDQALLESWGVEAVIADAGNLRYDGGRLSFAGQNIDLMYNRLTDFAFERPEHKALREAYRDGAVVVTPNPHNHALVADKRNLMLLSDPVTLEELGVESKLRALLGAIVPRTLLVTPAAADALWKSRKNLFFKPTGGHGGKAVYRGDKVTKGVWAMILQGGYVAQTLVRPSERIIKVDDAAQTRKLDVRLYTYDGRVLLAAARLYQGQTTNFQTPGGGFAPVFVI